MRSCPFIRVQKQENSSFETVIYVPPPTSVMGGMARRAWLVQYFQKDVFIASKERWLQLQDDHPIKYLVEENGLYSEEDHPPKTRD